MAQATADFELGVSGNDILVADAGSATAWDVRTNNGAGNTITYDNTHVYGTLAAKFDRSIVDNAACRMEWTTGIGTLTDWFGRIYLYATAFPAASFRVVLDITGNNQLCFINDTGKIRGFDTLGAPVYTTTNSIALNQWVRIEWHWIHSATVGQGEVKLFNSPDSATPTETVTSAADKNTGANTSNVGFGLSEGSVFTGPIWLDNIVAGATSYPGPVVTATANLAPVIYGRGAA
jgi:hypothetical protein